MTQQCNSSGCWELSHPTFAEALEVSFGLTKSWQDLFNSLWTWFFIPKIGYRIPPNPLTYIIMEESLGEDLIKTRAKPPTWSQPKRTEEMVVTKQTSSSLDMQISTCTFVSKSNQQLISLLLYSQWLILGCSSLLEEPLWQYPSSRHSQITSSSSVSNGFEIVHSGVRKSSKQQFDQKFRGIHWLQAMKLIELGVAGEPLRRWFVRCEKNRHVWHCMNKFTRTIQFIVNNVKEKKSCATFLPPGCLSHPQSIHVRPRLQNCRTEKAWSATHPHGSAFGCDQNTQDPFSKTTVVYP